MKQCFKCKSVLPLDAFYAHPAMRDGRLNKCKACTKSDATKHRAQNIDRIQEYDRARSKSPKRAAARAAYCKQFRAKNPEKYKAHSAVNSALKAGKICKQPCQECGAAKVDAHHTDYSKPLEVQWLCPSCHHVKHRKYDYSKLSHI